MTAMEYLSQGYRLDMKIRSRMEEQEALTEASRSVSSPMLCERVQTSKNVDAPFVSCYEKAEEMKKKIAAEIEELLCLKDQIRGVIDSVEDLDEQAVLRYRYINNYSWQKISRVMEVGRSTVFRWHKQALLHVNMPDEPIEL